MSLDGTLQNQIRSGDSKVAKKLAHSPSVQGPWTPFTNKDTSWNVAQFPNSDLSRCSPLESTATERLVELAKQLRIGNKSAEMPERSTSNEAVTQT